MEDIQEKINLSELNISSFESNSNIYYPTDRKKTKADLLTDLGECIYKTRIFGKQLKQFQKENRQNEDYYQYILQEKMNYQKNIVILQKKIDKIQEITIRLSFLRQLSWEIDTNNLNNQDMTDKEYIVYVISQLIQIQTEIDEIAIIDKEQYGYYYLHYLNIQERYNLP